MMRSRPTGASAATACKSGAMPATPSPRTLWSSPVVANRHAFDIAVGAPARTLDEHPARRSHVADADERNGTLRRCVSQSLWRYELEQLGAAVRRSAVRVDGSGDPRRRREVGMVHVGNTASRVRNASS